MTFNLEEHKNKLLFLPLGGAGEIGMNFNLYYYEGKWLIVDCGSGFAEDYMPGVDLIIPDISYIVKHRKDICGMVLTHAHEDHIGAVQYLWDALDCPIYTTNFTANFLKIKLSDAEQEATNKINILKPRSKTDIGPFKLEMVPLCHSAPEMQALLIKTKHGNIFHTGDWKFDPDPLIGEVNDEKLLKKYGDEGVLALIGDSTNVFNEDYSGSEAKLKESLTELVSSYKKMIIVTTFASNLARLEALIDIGAKSGRRVVLSGRSLHRVVKAAKASGYLQNIPKLLDERDISAYDRGSLFIIATGCQGEPLAAVTKIANGTHPRIQVRPDDVVIFSSKIIPGNDKKLFRVFNALTKLRVETLTEKDHFVHVSGHPGKKELTKLYKLLRPKTVVPVHGEHVHMHEHTKIAKAAGVENTVEVENGVVLALSPDAPRKIGNVEAGELGVYGNYLLRPDSKVLKKRRLIRNDGVCIVTLILAKNYKLAINPIITAPGFLDESEDKDLLIYMQEQISLSVHMLDIGKNKKQNMALETIEKSVKSRVKSILNQEIRKVPVIEVSAKTVS